MRFSVGRRFPILLLALAWMTGYAYARVFLEGNRSPVAEALAELGMQSVCSTQYKINGAGATLEMYGANMPLYVAAERLAATLKSRQLNVSLPSSESGAIGVLVTGNEIIRMLFLSTGADKVMLCIVRQSLEELASVRSSATNASIPDVLHPNVTSFPGSRMIYHVEDQKTKTTLGVYKASSTAEAVRAFYDRSMLQNGWQSISGVMYRRGSLNCIISVQPTQQPGEITITLLLRRSAL